MFDFIKPIPRDNERLKFLKLFTSRYVGFNQAFAKPIQIRAIAIHNCALHLRGRLTQLIHVDWSAFHLTD